MDDPLNYIASRGQSIWVDAISKKLLTKLNGNGSTPIDDLVKAGVRGLTSNPTLFKQSIADTSDYHEDILRLAKLGESPEGIVTKLMCEDVASAARSLLRVYEGSEGRDGFASIEVSPLLADSAEATVREAVLVWERIGLPNVMIKIPATEAGLTAIPEVLALGINVNVTLIFSVERYKAVFQAFRDGLSRRLKGSGGGSSGVVASRLASVASFFVSRLDALVERKIDAASVAKSSDLHSILGKVAIANCRRVYDIFEGFKATSECKDLLSKDCALQRPLWASTGVKNPEYDKLMYVESLVAPDTVNTVPLSTLQALLESDLGGIPVISLDRFPMDEAEHILNTLNAFGCNGKSTIYLDELCNILEVDGVKAFVDSYTTLVDSVRKAGGFS